MLASLIGLFNAVKQATPALLLGVALACGALLFAPASALQSLGVADLSHNYRQYVGAALLAATALLISQSLVGLFGLVKSFYAERKIKKEEAAYEQRRLEVLTKLTPEEKAYLTPYIAEEKNTIYFTVDDGIAGGLQAKGIIYRASNIGHLMSGFAYNLQPWAREHLNIHPYLLEGARAERRSRW